MFAVSAPKSFLKQFLEEEDQLRDALDHTLAFLAHPEKVLESSEILLQNNEDASRLHQHRLSISLLLSEDEASNKLAAS